MSDLRGRIDVRHVGCGGAIAVHATQPMPLWVLPPEQDALGPKLEDYFVIRCLKCGLMGRRLA